MRSRPQARRPGWSACRAGTCSACRTLPTADQVLPPTVPARVSIEAGSTFGWSRWVGDAGRSVGLDHFGASAPAEVLFEQFGFTVDHVVEVAREALAGT